MSFARRILAVLAAAGALAVAATGLTAGVAAADADSGLSVTCNGNDYDASYGPWGVSSNDVDCDAAQNYTWSLVR